MASLAAIALLGTGLAAYLVWRNGHITRAEAERWAALRGLTLTAENRATVTGYLHTAGLLRGLGLAAGLALPALYGWALGIRVGVWMPWASAFVGYLLGALYAEVSLRRPAGRRAAAMPRLLQDYLPPLLRRGQVVLGIVVALASTAALLAPRAGDLLGRSRVPLVLAGATALLAGPALLAIEGWLVRRPQPVLSAAQLAADDAIRSQSVQSIAASGMATQLALLSLPLWALATSDVRVLRWSMWPPALLCGWAALLVCLDLGRLGWRVRRPVPSGDWEATTC